LGNVQFDSGTENDPIGEIDKGASDVQMRKEVRHMHHRCEQPTPSSESERFGLAGRS